MNIANFRVDDRLVHGLVATNWVPSLNIERVLVIDEESAQSPMLKSALRMATPKEVFLSVIPVETASSNLLANKYGDEKIMVVVKSPETIIELCNAGIPVDKLVLGNLGNISKSKSTIAITKFISVNEQEEKLIDTLHEKGVKVISQLVPKDDEVDFIPLMKKKTNR